MLYISDNIIEKFIREDIPYLDLTTSLLEIGNAAGTINFSSHEDICLACTEEVVRLMKKLNIQTDNVLGSGTCVERGKIFLRARGSAAALHMAWKISQNILEYCCGIATRTKSLVDAVKAVDPAVSVITTRKSFPGTKELTLKSILAGGAFPHRLGLSETILIFKQHTNFLVSFQELSEKIKKVRINACEKKIIIEAENEEEALQMAKLDVDGIQFDKIAPDSLKPLVKNIRQTKPSLVLIAAGGINHRNVAAYAAAGIDAIATTSVYFGTPVDIKVTIEKTL
ncbi:ModD protein [Pectinatus haikarae]|uniref:Putative pyrophosphorylase ModD n=1 Tax=Pectinatus haikarae TaxID=349096 RepID=A0ABT9Y5Y3_9FIRM|nr:ModD protein [Pectinatus haikarae]MDQ0203227.1 molybdenum transport protein [Pectinatus haikarae]